jgi:ring-1,2-phenylacetyl-CoA epoxidase subunit PaaE
MELKLKNKILSENKEVVYLTFSPENKINFKAGQFMMLDNWEIKRAYSIASSPLDEDISFYVKKASENGMSKYLVEDMKVDDKIIAIWPFGHMVVEEDENTNYLLISVWSWLGPILSIYRYLIQTKKFSKIYNLYWERYENTIVKDILNEMKWFESENVKNTFFLSREEKTGFENWYVEKWIEKALDFLWKDNLKVYMCGKPEMVDDTIEKLLSLWVNQDNIKFEKF